MSTPATVPPTPVTPPKGGATPPGPNDVSSDPLIAQLQKAIRAKVPPQYAVAVQKIYLAGMKLMFSPETHQHMVQAIQSDTDPGHAVGAGIVSLITMMFQQSKGTLPIPACVPAGVLLVAEGLDFMEQTKMIPKVTPDMVDSAVQTLVSMLMQKVGMTPDRMAQIATQAKNGQMPANAPPPTGAAPAAPAAPAGAPGLIQGAQQ
jgi:hypothetical protein